MPDELMTTADVGREIGVDPRTVARWIREGKLEAIEIRVHERVTYRIRRSAFRNFVSRYARGY